MLGIMSRTEDNTRPFRPYRSDAHEDTKELTYPPTFPAPLDQSIRGDVNPHSHRKILSQEETLELAKRAVENGLQETKRSLAGSEAVDDVVRPKLTIDLGHSNIGSIPESMVDVIKDEVARLSLSNNHIDHIPGRFSECTHLRYLNIRANNFTQFPKEVFGLTFLEILDLSRNKITKIPEEIRKLTSLRVLSIMQNLLDDLPTELADMTKLQVLKVSGNSLKYPLKRVLELKETDVSASEMTDNEKETAITAELKLFLKTRQPVTYVEFDAGSESSETLVDTPKPLKRGNRFPVIPRTNGSESAHSSRSPSLSRPPPIPTRSHHRMASGQNGVLQLGVNSRTGLATYSGTSERNRSNSEGVITGPGASRSRRMGLITWKNTDLGTLDEGRPYRNSHVRGLSHGSILRSKHGGMSGGGSSSSSPGSPRERRKLKDAFIRRMSSLPEHRIKVAGQEPIIDAAKGVLYALYQLHPHVSLLINVLKGEDARRNSLEIVFYNAETHLERLNDSLESAGRVDLQDADGVMRVCEVVKRECETCIMAYIHVATQLRLAVGRAVSFGDPKFLRSLLLMIFGSLTELRNACSHLGINLHSEQQSSSGKKSQASTSMAKKGQPVHTGESAVTPTAEKTPPTRRLRSDTTIVHPIAVPNSNNVIYQQPNSNSTPVQFNAPYTLPSVPMSPQNYGCRSRSSSRSNTRLTSGSPSLANTPRSGETFGSTNTLASSRTNIYAALDEVEVERIFEKIFFQLTSAYTAALHALPYAARQFTQYLELAEETRAPEELRILCHRLILRCRVCQDVSESLRHRLSNMTLKEPGYGTRNQREFWQLCKTFIQVFVELVTDMREARNFNLINPEVVIVLRPVQKASREAGRLIDASPWSYLAELNTSNPTTFYPPQTQAQHFPHYTNSSTSTMLSTASTLTNGSSSQFVPLPATPLSAALGPAAQATVPSTPASAYSDRFFAGDVFQRADSVLNTANPAPMFARR
ncbi:cell morphogenesis protein Sog2 [Histoplasma capsulatum var. duboisii H88]|uniref:Cell morphogenesis protein Sog2 n=1 Tax=Ajellomyces capsulatus (strain H88) TaxID=544711 RepID=F0U5J4_AJEC8|nr:cell morphogenesis protein Sog2 [Histoplasma capsulatum var. duboisii H88]QSS51444.1 cell morphogenesis protein Sog2 [Histoplasma capsulatum var. duboisii H88]